MFCEREILQVLITIQQNDKTTEKLFNVEWKSVNGITLDKLNYITLTQLYNIKWNYVT